MSHTASNTKNKTVEIDYTTTIDVREEDNNTALMAAEEDENSMNASQGTTTINSQNTKPANVTDDSGYVDDTKIPASAAGIKYILTHNNADYYLFVGYMILMNYFLPDDDTCNDLQTWCEAAKPDCEQIFVKQQCKKYCGLCPGTLFIFQ